MKKKYLFKHCLALAVSVATLTGCIEETLPEGGTATSEQIGASATALEASVNGIPSQMVQGYLVYGTQSDEKDIAYPQLLLTQTELLGDIFPFGDNYGYDWWWRYAANWTVDATSDEAYLPYFTLYQFIKSANDIIGAVDITNEGLSDEMRGYAGIAYACRAYYYYMLMVFYEPVENIYTDVSDVLGLTVPIVTEATTSEMATNNPRATHDEMMEFILSDLNTAEELLANFTPSTKYFPDLAVTYGIKAKVYLWDENYAEAANYARMAINECGGAPMTEAEWLDPRTGFNTATSGWMWYLHPTASNMGNLANFIGHISGESDWGYGSLSQLMISAWLYDQIADTDFRKYTFLDPDRTFYDYQTVHEAGWLDDKPDYFSLKFRCANGDYSTYSIGAEADIPIMRVEEMYLIEAEAVGMSQGVSAGVALLNSFMQNYRQPDYNCTLTSEREFQLEVLKQMRIEFWGEGNAFPSAKRIKPDVIQNFEGTNAPIDQYKINCEGIKPCWNFVIPIDEVNANSALQGMNNPDPSGAIPARPTPIGEFAPGNN